MSILGEHSEFVGRVIFVGEIMLCGTKMSETTSKVDEKGRVRIPKRIREAIKLKEGSCVNVRAEGKTIVIELAEPLADKYYGAFKVDKWPEDLDEFAGEVMRKRWRHRDI